MLTESGLLRDRPSTYSLKLTSKTYLESRVNKGQLCSTDWEQHHAGVSFSTCSWSG